MLNSNGGHIESDISNIDIFKYRYRIEEIFRYFNVVTQKNKEKKA